MDCIRLLLKFLILCSVLQFLESSMEYETQIHVSRHCISPTDPFRASRNRDFLIIAISLDVKC